jgi:hypothetical protein
MHFPTKHLQEEEKPSFIAYCHLEFVLAQVAKNGPKSGKQRIWRAKRRVHFLTCHN